MRLDLITVLSHCPAIDVFRLSSSNTPFLFFRLESTSGKIVPQLHFRSVCLTVRLDISPTWQFYAFIFQPNKTLPVNLTIFYVNQDNSLENLTGKIPGFECPDSLVSLELGHTVLKKSLQNLVFGEISDCQFYERSLSEKELNSLRLGFPVKSQIVF
jgi:hypothetical protein